jgi:hypothetical protein
MIMMARVSDYQAAGRHSLDSGEGNMDAGQLKDMLVQHALWLETGMAQGARADLSYANLSGADLGGVNLSGADLGGVNLSGADLGGVNLSGADLGGVNLSGADLGGVNLSGANLYGAYLCDINLGGADLGGADLGDANLRGANLRDTNLNDANLYGADLYGADLSGAVGPVSVFSSGWHTGIATCSHIAIGCERHTHAEWRERYEEIGIANNYTSAEIERYRQWIFSLDWLTPTVATATPAP